MQMIMTAWVNTREMLEPRSAYNKYSVIVNCHHSFPGGRMSKRSILSSFALCVASGEGLGKEREESVGSLCLIGL